MNMNPIVVTSTCTVSISEDKSYFIVSCGVRCITYLIEAAPNEGFRIVVGEGLMPIVFSKRKHLAIWLHGYYSAKYDAERT